MYYYEIKNKDTNETYQVIGQSFAKACKAKGWKPNKGKCIWKASAGSVCDPPIIKAGFLFWFYKTNICFII